MAKLINVKPFRSLDPKAVYLVLISPERLPHLGLIRNGAYYSLTVCGPELGLEAETMLTKIQRLGKKLILIQLSSDIDDPLALFEKYRAAESGAVTCLPPVRDALIPGSKASFVFELIPELYAADMITEVFHRNLVAELDELNDFRLLEYTKDDIYHYINQLNKKYV